MKNKIKILKFCFFILIFTYILTLSKSVNATNNQIINYDEYSLKLKQLLKVCQSIFFTEQAIILNLISDNISINEEKLNKLYKNKEILILDLGNIILSDKSYKALKITKSIIFSNKLYNLYNLESFPNYMLAKLSHISETNEINFYEKLKDNLLELRSYIELENKRLVDPVSFIKDIEKNINNNLEDILITENTNEYNNIINNLQLQAPINIIEVNPKPFTNNAKIDTQIIMRFKNKNNSFIQIKKILLNNKYVKSSTNKNLVLDYKLEDNFLKINTKNLETNTYYNVLIELESKLNDLSTNEVFYFQNKSINDGIFKTLTLNFNQNLINYVIEWNFKTISYKLVSSEVLLLKDSSINDTVENILDQNTTENELLTKDTIENNLKDNLSNTTSETKLTTKEIEANINYETSKNIPIILEKFPCGSNVLSNSKIYIIFSCELDSLLISNNNIKFYVENDYYDFELIKDYNLKVLKNKVEIVPKNLLLPSRNYKIVVTDIVTKDKLHIPLNETYYFKTACAVTNINYVRNKDKKIDTIEITLSDKLDDININLIEINDKKEKHIEFEKQIVTVEINKKKNLIEKVVLGSLDNKSKPKNLETPTKKLSIKLNESKNLNLIKPRYNVKLIIKPKKSLESNLKYKIDIFSNQGIIENGIIRF